MRFTLFALCLVSPFLVDIVHAIRAIELSQPYHSHERPDSPLIPHECLNYDENECCSKTGHTYRHVVFKNLQVDDKVEVWRSGSQDPCAGSLVGKRTTAKRVNQVISRDGNAISGARIIVPDLPGEVKPAKSGHRSPGREAGKLSLITLTLEGSTIPFGVEKPRGSRTKPIRQSVRKMAQDKASTEDL